MNKKHLKIGVAVVLLGAAGIVFFALSGSNTSSGIENYRGELQQLQCSRCSHRMEMDKADYLKKIEQDYDNLEGSFPCPSCGAAMAEMITCSKCKHVFRKSAFPQDFADRCPQCKYSEIEQSRNN